MKIDAKSLKKGILARDLSVLSKAITYLESEHTDKREIVTSVLNQEKINPSIVIGFTGSPGVGKSSFIETFGYHLCEQGKKICVLAIDPSSTVSGGSILGDKTRMSKLSNHQNAFIRPTPSNSELGGVGAKTFETINLCEAFGFDYLFVETVGVGQSEIEVRYLADLVVLLLEPGAGDELQGIKRGIMEIADIVLVNKADQDENLAKHSKNHYQAALHILRSKMPYVELTSAYTSLNFDLIIDEINKLDLSTLEKRRAVHYKKWFYKLLSAELVERFKKKNLKELAKEEFLDYPPKLLKKYLTNS